jgi:uncharacterized protein (UPF0261 family)
MKTTIIGLLLAICTLSVNAQSKITLNQEKANHALEKAKKVQKTGAILTVTGGVATIVGIVMAENGLFKRYPSTPGHITGDTYSTLGGAIGIGLIIAGVPLICIGVPTFFVGSIQKGRAQRNLQISFVNIKSPMNCSSVNGIGLKVRF